ncbi:MAG: hypothetical protein ABSG32_33965 [Terriglobia bacterium]
MGELVAIAKREKQKHAFDLYFACCLQAAWRKTANDSTSTVLLTAKGETVISLDSCRIPVLDCHRAPKQHQKTLIYVFLINADGHGTETQKPRKVSVAKFASKS